MSIAAWVGSWVRGKAEPVVVVERPVQLWEPGPDDEWTVAGTVQLMIANGADEKEIREFREACGK